MHLEDILLRFMSEEKAHTLADMFPFIIAGIALLSFYLLIAIIQMVRDD